MGASKTKQHGIETLRLANIARALAHPARIRILEIIREKHYVRNTHLCSELQLCNSTIHQHLLKMREAGIIYLSYEFNGYLIIPIPERIETLKHFLDQD